MYLEERVTSRLETDTDLCSAAALGRAAARCLSPPSCFRLARNIPALRAVCPSSCRGEPGWSRQRAVGRGSGGRGFPARMAEKMFDIKGWAEYIVEWAAKDPYGFLTTVILALTPLFLASAVLSWKLAKMIEAREREQKKKQKRQENIAKAKQTKKD
uniref:Small integral membrane protein 15 n=1 Tax=Pelusios castaneus TaxID=367368 RepID=A0A8C8S5W5_9SAUR